MSTAALIKYPKGYSAHHMRFGRNCHTFRMGKSSVRHFYYVINIFSLGHCAHIAVLVYTGICDGVTKYKCKHIQKSIATGKNRFYGSTQLPIFAYLFGRLTVVAISATHNYANVVLFISNNFPFRSERKGAKKKKINKRRK